MWWPPSWFWSRSHLDFDRGPWSAVMKRIDSFFIKCDTPQKKQCVDKQVKEDEAQWSNSQPKNPSSEYKQLKFVPWQSSQTLSSWVKSNVPIFCSFWLSIQWDLKTTRTVEVCLESLRAMLEYWYIERGLFRLRLASSQAQQVCSKFNPGLATS